jgi:hypothetical protein
MQCGIKHAHKSQASAVVRSKCGRYSSLRCCHCVLWDEKMQTVFVVVVVWVALSCTLGPLLTWAFFYWKRRARAIQAPLDHRTATDPAAPLLAPDLLEYPSTFEGSSFSDHRGSFVNHRSSQSPSDAL